MFLKNFMKLASKPIFLKISGIKSWIILRKFWIAWILKIEKCLKIRNWTLNYKNKASEGPEDLVDSALVMEVHIVNTFRNLTTSVSCKYCHEIHFLILKIEIVRKKNSEILKYWWHIHIPIVKIIDEIVVHLARTIISDIKSFGNWISHLRDLNIFAASVEFTVGRPTSVAPPRPGTFVVVRQTVTITSRVIKFSARTSTRVRD